MTAETWIHAPRCPQCRRAYASTRNELIPFCSEQCRHEWALWERDELAATRQAIAERVTGR